MAAAHNTILSDTGWDRIGVEASNNIAKLDYTSNRLQIPYLILSTPPISPIASAPTSSLCLALFFSTFSINASPAL